MDTLLKAIQSALKAASTLSYLKGSVHILPEGPDHDALPKTSKFPLIGITDGTEEITHETGKRYRVIRWVRISAYKEVVEREKAIVGDDVVKGVVTIMKDVQAVLEYNKVGLSGYTIALSANVEASTVVDLGNILAVKKTIIFRYRFLT